MFSKRDLLKATAMLGAGLPEIAAAQSFSDVAPGPFKPDWDSLKAQYQAPDWFRDAKFGIWAHWSAQCVPEAGDWYARNMYIQGTSSISIISSITAIPPIPASWRWTIAGRRRIGSRKS